MCHSEETSDVNAAIAREKEIKKWRREKRIILLIEQIKVGKI
jgi:predicted GIY-YIG superfamily endonuclease